MLNVLDPHDVPAALLDGMGAHAPNPAADVACFVWLAPAAMRRMFDSMAELMTRDPDRAWCRYAAYITDDLGIAVFVWSRFGYFGFKVDAEDWGWARLPS